MSLIVYPYFRDQQTGELVDADEQAKPPFNDSFGFENWRKTIWGTESIRKLNCGMLNSLQDQDVYAEGAELKKLHEELKMVKVNLGQISAELNLQADGLEFRIDNALEATRIALKYENGGVYIG